MDDLDRAQIFEERERVTSIERARLARIAERFNVAQISRRHCADCGKPIPAARRRAVPWATLCIGCAQSAEAERMQRRAL